MTETSRFALNSVSGERKKIRMTLDRLYFVRRDDGPLDFIAAESREQAEKITGLKSDGFISLSKTFRPEERSAFHLAAALDLAAEEYSDVLDLLERTTVRRCAGKIRQSFFN